MHPLSAIFGTTFWLGLSTWAGSIVRDKGRCGPCLFALGLLVSPIIGIIAALVIVPNEARLRSRALQDRLPQ